MFYDFNSKQLNYSISKNHKGIGFNFAQQFREGLTITSANFGYALEGIGIPGKLQINYVLSNYKNKQDSDKLGIIFQEKIRFLNLEGKLEKTPFGLIPSITGKINCSWN